MIKKCYLFTRSETLTRAISNLCNTIPCFIDMKDFDANHFEFYITCRAEDIRTVENRLARFV